MHHQKNVLHDRCIILISKTGIRRLRPKQKSKQNKQTQRDILKGGIIDVWNHPASYRIKPDA